MQIRDYRQGRAKGDGSMSGSMMHCLYSFLLERAQEAPTLRDAELDLLILHAVLVARLEKKGVANATEAQVYAELKMLLEEGQ
jgi:hypothetical protein